MTVLTYIHLIAKFLIKKVIIIQKNRIILRLDVLLLFDMRLSREKMTNLTFFPEVKRQTIFGNLFILLSDDSKQHHFIILGSVMIIMLIINMQ